MKTQLCNANNAAIYLSTHSACPRPSGSHHSATQTATLDAKQPTIQTPSQDSVGFSIIPRIFSNQSDPLHTYPQIPAKLTTRRYMGLLRNQTSRTRSRIQLVQSKHLQPLDNYHQPNSPTLLQPDQPTNRTTTTGRIPRHPKRPILGLRPHPRNHRPPTRLRCMVNPEPRPRSRESEKAPRQTPARLPQSARYRSTRIPRHGIPRRRRADYRANSPTPPALHIQNFLTDSDPRFYDK